MARRGAAAAYYIGQISAMGLAGDAAYLKLLPD